MIRHFATIAFISCFAILAQDKPIDFSSFHPLACPHEIVEKINDMPDSEIIILMIPGSIDNYHVDLSNTSFRDHLYHRKIPLFLYPYFWCQVINNTEKLFQNTSNETKNNYKNSLLSLQKSFGERSIFASTERHRLASLTMLNYLSLERSFADIILFEKNDILHLRSRPGSLNKFNGHDRSGLNPVMCFIRSVEADKSFSTDKKRLEHIANYLLFSMSRGFNPHSEVSDCSVEEAGNRALSVISYPDKKIIIHKWLEEKYNKLVSEYQADDGYLHKALITSTFFDGRLSNYRFRRQSHCRGKQPPSDLILAAQNSRFSDVLIQHADSSNNETSKRPTKRQKLTHSYNF